jgi:hypothetical protein
MHGDQTVTTQQPLVQTDEQSHMRRDHREQPGLAVAVLKRLATLESFVCLDDGNDQQYQDHPTKNAMQMYKSGLHVTQFIEQLK